MLLVLWPCTLLLHPPPPLHPCHNLHGVHQALSMVRSAKTSKGDTTRQPQHAKKPKTHSLEKPQLKLTSKFHKNKDLCIIVKDINTDTILATLPFGVNPTYKLQLPSRVILYDMTVYVDGEIDVSWDVCDDTPEVYVRSFGHVLMAGNPNYWGLPHQADPTTSTPTQVQELKIYVAAKDGSTPRYANHPNVTIVNPFGRLEVETCHCDVIVSNSTRFLAHDVYDRVLIRGKLDRVNVDMRRFTYEYEDCSDTDE